MQDAQTRSNRRCVSTAAHALDMPPTPSPVSCRHKPLDMWRQVRGQLVAQERARHDAGANTARSPPRSWCHRIPIIEDGCLLLANTPGMGFHERAVVLVVQNNAQSSAGLLLNRASPLSVADLNTCDASKACFAGAAVRAGGSQSPASLLVLHGHAEVTDSRCVAPGLYTGGLRTACALVHAGAVRAESFALLAGYMAWPPGELRRQTEAGLWLPVSVSPELVLQVACDTTFQHLAWYRLFSSVSIADRS